MRDERMKLLLLHSVEAINNAQFASMTIPFIYMVTRAHLT